MSIRKFLVVLSLAATALSAAAQGQSGIVKSVQLKDGTTMHQYKDGKMAMEDKNGRVTYMKEGMTMETADGQSISMTGNEVARLFNEKRMTNRK